MGGRLVAIGVAACTFGLPMLALATPTSSVTSKENLAISAVTTGGTVGLWDGPSTSARPFIVLRGDIAADWSAPRQRATAQAASKSSAPPIYLAQVGQQGPNSRVDPIIGNDLTGGPESVANSKVDPIVGNDPIEGPGSINGKDKLYYFPILRILYYILKKHQCVSPSRPDAWCY